MKSSIVIGILLLGCTLKPSKYLYGQITMWGSTKLDTMYTCMHITGNVQSLTFFIQR